MDTYRRMRPSYLIRTTFFTRFDQSKRADEQKDSNIPEQQELMAMTAQNEKADPVPVVIPEEKYENRFVLILKGLCGVQGDPKDENKMNADEQKCASDEHQLVKVQSLKQTTMEKWLLNSFLVIIICVAISLYAFFSISPLPEDEIEQLRMGAFYQVINNFTAAKN